MAGQRKSQISELQFDNFSTPSLLYWKDQMQNPRKFLFRFSIGCFVMDNLKSSRSVAGNDFPNFEMLDAKIASGLNKIIQNSHFKKRVSLVSSVCLRKTDRLHDLRLLSSHWRSWHSTGLCGFILYHSSQRRCSRPLYRFDEVLSMTKIPSDDVLEVCTNWEYASLINSKTVLKWYDMEIHQKIFVAQLSEVEDNGEKEHGSETSITSFWRQKWENWDMGSGYASQEIKWYWKRTRFLRSMGQQEDSAQV